MRNLAPEEELKLKNFFDACNEMIQGRFILSDIKISKILKTVAESSLLYDLFTKCLINFNFERELRDAKTSNRVNGGYFKMPSEEHKIIALVFALLLEVDNKKINLQNFITENFFSSQGYNVSYSNFALVMLIPFKTAVMNELKCKEDGTHAANEDEELQELEQNQLKMEQVLETAKETYDPKIKIKFANLRVALGELGNAVKVSRKLKLNQKEELMIIINAMFDCIKQENIKLISALVIAFEYALGKNKEIKYYYNNFLQHLLSLI